MTTENRTRLTYTNVKGSVSNLEGGSIAEFSPKIHRQRQPLPDDN